MCSAKRHGRLVAIADILRRESYVRFTPKPDIATTNVMSAQAQKRTFGTKRLSLLLADSAAIHVLTGRYPDASVQDIR